jgi:hypothetical protein
MILGLNGKVALKGEIRTSRILELILVEAKGERGGV